MNKNPIYTVTTLRGSLYGGTRCVGFYHDLQTAIDAVEENACDINECEYYPFCVIEKTSPGIYSLDDLVGIWFRWHRKHGYQRIDKKPDNFKCVIGFGIG